MPGRLRRWGPPGLVVLLALALRLPALLAGQLVWHPDEIFMVVVPLGMFGGDLNPHHFHYPSLHFYTLAAAFGLRFLLQTVAGGPGLHEWIVVHTYWQPEALRDTARWVSLVYATGTVAIVGGMARRLYGAVDTPGIGRHAWLAAPVLLAVSVTHVRQSPLAGVDAALAFWFCAAVWGAVRLVGDDNRRSYLLAGVLCGLTVAVKYPGAAAFAVLLAAHLLGASRRHRRLAMAVAAGFGTFVLCSPYVLLDWQTFLGHFAFQVEHVHGGRGEAQSALWFHLTSSLRHSLGLVAWVATVPAVVLALRGRREEMVVVVACVAMLAAISWGRLAFLRYALPLVCLQSLVVGGLAARGLVALRSRSGSRWRLAAAGVAALALLTQPVHGAVRTANLQSTVDTRTLARAWMEAHVPAGTLCCNFGGWPGDVQVRTAEQMWWRVRQLEMRTGSQASIELLRRTDPGTPFYRYAVQAMDEDEVTGSLRAMSRDRCRYAILHRHPLEYSSVDSVFARQLQGAAERVWSVSPWRGSQTATFDPSDAYYLPVTGFGDVLRPGPEIEIWRFPDQADLEPAPWSVERLAATLQVYEAEVLDREGDRDAAVARLRRALATDADHPGALLWLGDYAAAARNAEDAVGYYVRALEADPTNAYVFQQLGVTLHALEQTDEAIEALRRAASLDPDNAAYQFNAGTALLRAGRTAEALTHVRRAVELAPDNLSFRFNVGAAERQAGNVDAALVNLRLAARAPATRAMALAALAELFEEIGEGDSAGVYRQRLEAHRRGAADGGAGQGVP